MLAEELPAGPDGEDDGSARSKGPRPGSQKSRANASNLKLASESSSEPADGPPSDAADAFLAQLERVDAGTLDISQLLENIEAPSETDRSRAPERTETKPVTPPAPVHGRPSAAAGAPAPATHRKASPASPPRERSSSAAADAAASRPAASPLLDDETPSQSGGNGRLVAIGVGALVIVGIAIFALRGRGPAEAPTTQPPASSAPAAGNTAPQAATSPAAAPSPAVDIDTQVRQFGEAAQQRLASGQRAEAADAISQGLALRSSDATLQAAAKQWLADARTAYDRARRDARAVNATGTPRYRDAERLRDVARRRGTSTLDAARAYESAIVAMNDSADAARKAAEARAAAAAAVTAPAPSAAITPAPAAPPARPAETVAAPPQNLVVAPPSASSPTPAPAPARVEAAAPPVSTPAPAAVRETPAPAAAAPAVAETAPATREAAPARTAANDEQSIRGVLQAYADAYSRLDANAVQGVFPSTDVAGLQRSFARMRSQRVQIVNERIQVNGATATVTCTWQTVFELSAGGPNRSAPQTTLTLQRSGNTWLIVGRR